MALSCRVWLTSGETYELPYNPLTFAGHWESAMDNNKVMYVPGRDEWFSPRAVVRVSAS